MEEAFYTTDRYYPDQNRTVDEVFSTHIRRKSAVIFEYGNAMFPFRCKSYDTASTEVRSTALHCTVLCCVVLCCVVLAAKRYQCCVVLAAKRFHFYAPRTLSGICRFIDHVEVHHNPSLSSFFTFQTLHVLSQYFRIHFVIQFFPPVFFFLTSQLVPSFSGL